MKKTLLFSLFALFSLMGKSQIIFHVENPSNLVGNYDFKIAASTGWGIPDMSDPINAVVDTLAIADDGTSADSTACINSVNSNVNGKIAVIYRGGCEFGTKALNAQNAGAVGVIIINNVGTPSITPGGGTDGPNVSIPVIMIDSALGASFRDSIDNGNMVAYIGTQYGYFGNDLGYHENNVLRAKQFGNFAPISQNASQFDVEVGAWVYNYGQNSQSDVVLTADVTLNGTSLYSQASSPVSIPSSDSAFISLPMFSQSSYASGYYTLNYTLTSSASEEYPGDNTVTTYFAISDSLYSYATLDSVTNLPITTGGSRTSGGTGDFTACITFKSPNATSVGLTPTGLTFSAMTNSPDVLTGVYMTTAFYEWGDAFTDINDATFNSLNQVASGEYIYISDLQREAVYAPFFEQYAIQDNQWYLACVTATSATTFIGYDNDIDYELNSKTYKMPMFPVGESIATQPAFGGGTGEGGLTTQAPAISLHLSTGVGIEETSIQEVKAYPNPTANFISVPLGNLEGKANVTIVDAAGKIVKTETVTILSSQITQFDVSDLPNGMYFFNINLDNGNITKFNVVINK